MQTKLSYGRDDIKIINDFMGKFFDDIQKAKVYVKNPQQAPQGTKVSRGKHGGLFYETGERQHFAQEVSTIEQNIKSTMKFSSEDANMAENLISKYKPIAKNEFKRVLSLTGANTSYRIKNKYSILEKMKRKNYKISDMQDIFGMRIEVNDVAGIYNTVQKLEKMYGNKIIIKEDYISSPKGVYRAYHLNVQYEPGIYGEIQIRTPLMDKIGNASHILLYKNTKELNPTIKANIEDTLNIYSNIAVGKARMEDLRELPETKKILGDFGL